MVRSSLDRPSAKLHQLIAISFATVLIASCAQGPEVFETGHLPIDSGPRERVELPHQDRTDGDEKVRGGEDASNPGSEFDVVSVFWGTNRKSKNGNGRLAFSSKNAGKLSVGRAHVTIPKIGRERGSVQRPVRYAVLGVELYNEKEDPKRHFTMGDIKSLTKDHFAREANALMRSSRRFAGEAFVFIHGYNTTFDAAVYRTAQLAYDLEFDGVPYLFSWPSRGELLAYVHDRDKAEVAERYLLEYLDFIARKTNARRIHVIAHSMGTKPTVRVLKAIKTGGQESIRAKLAQVILAAPDIDKQVFEQIASSIKGVGRGLTLYASANDQALVKSRQIALGSQRAGEVTAAGPVVVAGIDTIDITNAGFESLWSLNHSTFAERSHILKDVQLLLKSGTRPPDQRMPIYERQALVGGKTYWRYVKN